MSPRTYHNACRVCHLLPNLAGESMEAASAVCLPLPTSSWRLDNYCSLFHRSFLYQHPRYQSDLRKANAITPFVLSRIRTIAMAHKASLSGLLQPTRTRLVERRGHAPASGPNALPLGRRRTRPTHQASYNRVRRASPQSQTVSSDEDASYESLLDTVGKQLANTSLQEDEAIEPVYQPNEMQEPNTLPAIENWFTETHTFDGAESSDEDVQMPDNHGPKTPVHRGYGICNTRRRRASEPIYVNHCVGLGHPEATPSRRLSKGTRSTSPAQDPDIRCDYSARRQRKILKRRSLANQGIQLDSCARSAPHHNSECQHLSYNQQAHDVILL